MRTTCAGPDGARTASDASGFPGARSITLIKLRGDARSALILACLIVAATVAVLGASQFGSVNQEIGGFLGVSLRASETAH